ncbi:MAG TPA: ArsA-related P-loop ATPase [Vicinamibacteria bacterium]|jgi:anion-transporting  ArsA/GET3 family ATPase
MPRPGRRPAEALLSELRERGILVVCGSGGVGKTTVAAALGLHAALSGRRVLVCTIDPSRRLATSLGLEKLSGKPRQLDLGRFGPALEGSLHAMVLDTKRTFDEIVTRYAENESARRRILSNRLYKQVSAALVGSHEYMAMEKLLELSEDDRFDLVVLDTPPTRHALDFLEAPDRLMSFLDTSILRFFLKPYFVAGRLTLSVATRTGALALKLADRFLGLQFLQDLSEFFLAFGGMYDGFKERAARVHGLLRDPCSGFLLVAGPSSAALDEALFFHRRLDEEKMPFLGFVVNRVHPDPASAAGGSGAGPRARVDDETAERLLDCYREQRTLFRAERKTIGRIEVDTGERPLLVPELDQDVHDLRGLREVGDLLFSEALPARRERGRASS